MGKRKKTFPKVAKEGAVRRRTLRVLYAMAAGGMYPESVEDFAEVSRRTLDRIIHDAREVGFIVDREEGKLYLSVPEDEKNRPVGEEDEEDEEEGKYKEE